MIKLISITKPLIEGVNTANDLIAYAARVSSPQNQLNTETADKLLRYCLKHKHFSIFEQVSCGFEIETTRDIGRQILRHKSFSFQEFSQRYAQAAEEPIFRECRLQDKKNRQSSNVTDDNELNEWWKGLQDSIWDNSYFAYEEALKSGIAKEQARALLPEGMVKTRMYLTGNLRSFITWIMVRAGKETQKEHRDIAKSAAKILEEHFEFLKEVFAPIYDDNYSAEQ
jgi:thymidylate synthase (FAD)